LGSYATKLKHILPAFFSVAFGTIIALALVRWFFCIQFLVFDIREEIWEFWIPFTLPWIPILLWLRPRFKALIFKTDPAKRRDGLKMIAWFTMIPMLILSQKYLVTATGKLQHLNAITDIEKVKRSRYYKIDRFYVPHNYGGRHTQFSKSDKGRTLNFNIYFATPILIKPTSKIPAAPKYWHGVTFSKSISNRASKAEKDRAYQDFLSDCLQQMSAYDFQDLVYFESVPNSNKRQDYFKAIEANTRQMNDNYIVLEPVRENFEDRNGNKLQWVFGSFAIGLCVLLLALILPRYSEALRIKEKNKAAIWVRVQNYIRSFQKNQKTTRK